MIWFLGGSFRGGWRQRTEVSDLTLKEYALADQREVEISFSDLTEGTFVQLIFDAENENSLELQQFGWQSILNNFKAHTEKS
jgi:sirohydrochlorin ferrochelatase